MFVCNLIIYSSSFNRSSKLPSAVSISDLVVDDSADSAGADEVVVVVAIVIVIKIIC